MNKRSPGDRWSFHLSPGISPLNTSLVANMPSCILVIESEELKLSQYKLGEYSFIAVVWFIIIKLT